MTVTVRRIRADEGPTLARLRLAALADAPSAFSSTHDVEARRSPQEWAERAAAGAAGDTQAMFLAVLGGDVVGLVGGVRSSSSAPMVEVVSMWTAPAARRAGVGRLLLHAVTTWAGATGAAEVQLWVTRGNEAAHHLYESMGFRPTGDHQPLPSDPCRDEIRMAMVLS